MIWGMHTPGQLLSLGLGVVVVVFEAEFFFFFLLFKQHFPLLGHFAFLSMLSQRRAKNPATQVPLQAPPAAESDELSRGALLVDVRDVVVVFLVVVVGAAVVVEVV